MMYVIYNKELDKFLYFSNAEISQILWTESSGFFLTDELVNLLFEYVEGGDMYDAPIDQQEILMSVFMFLKESCGFEAVCIVPLIEELFAIHEVYGDCKSLVHDFTKSMDFPKLVE